MGIQGSGLPPPYSPSPSYDQSNVSENQVSKTLAERIVSYNNSRCSSVMLFCSVGQFFFEVTLCCTSSYLHELQLSAA